MCVTHPLSKPQKLLFLSIADSGFDLFAAGGKMRKLGEEAQEGSRVTESPEMLQNSSFLQPGQDSQVVTDLEAGRGPLG